MIISENKYILKQNLLFNRQKLLDLFSFIYLINRDINRNLKFLQTSPLNFLSLNKLLLCLKIYC